MKSILYNNYKIFIPERYYIKPLLARFNNNKYEYYEALFVKEICNKNDYVLEIGSGLGYVTALLAFLCSHVISVEANPELDICRGLTIEANHLDNVTQINGYVSNSKESVVFKTYDLLVAGSANRKDNAGSWKKTEKEYILECIKTNDIPNISMVNTLIMDCEGAELEFLLDNKPLLEQCNKILIELHESMMFRGFGRKCLDILKENNFILKKNYKNKFVYLSKNANS